MKNTLIILALIILISACGHKKKTTTNFVNSELNIDTSCVTGFEKLDNLPEWKDKLLDLSVDIPNYKQCAADIEFADSALGLAVYKNINNATYTLLLLTPYKKECKVIGSKNLGKISSTHIFQGLCSAKCDYETPAIAEIIADKTGKTTSIRAWCVNKKNRKITIVKPSKIDCTEAFNTSYD